jgi:hypothetical protein
MLSEKYANKSKIKEMKMKKILISILVVFTCLTTFLYYNISNYKEHISDLEDTVSAYENQIEKSISKDITMDSEILKLQNESSSLVNQLDSKSIEIDELSLRLHNLQVINDVYIKATELNVSKEEYDSSDIFNTTEGSYVEIVKSDDEIVLVNLHLFGEMGQIKESYSSLGTDIYFIELQELMYKEPFTLSNSELVINRYFLIRNTLVRVLEDGSFSESEPEEKILDRFNEHRKLIEKFTNL